MALFGNITSNISSLTGTINNFTSNLNNTINNTVRDIVSPVSNTINNVRSVQSSIENLLTGSASNLTNLSSSVRMSGNALQGVNRGASPSTRNQVTAIAAEDLPLNRTDSALSGDWRVGLSVPREIQGGAVLEPLAVTGDRMIFPFNPVIFMSQRANYSTITPTHTNYAFHAYQNSQIDDITITGEFFVENESDALYWVAAIHFLRSMTKMFYGDSDPLGNPPLVSRLNGYGKYVLNDIPVVLTNFTVDLPGEVDYIPCYIQGDIDPNYVPTQSQISVTCSPNYARRSHSKFDLKKFADGGFVGGPEGFI